MKSEMHTPIATVIEKNYERFASDPDYIESLKKLDKTKLREGTKDLKDNISILINYYVFRRHLLAIKIVKGHLGNIAEKSLVSRGNEALQAYERIAESFSKIDQAATVSGLSTVIERRIGSLCEHLDRNPKILPFLAELEEMGLTKAEIACGIEDLRKNEFNLLRSGGSDGTFSGFMRRLDDLKGDFHKELDIIEKHGLPTIVGAGGNTSGTTIAVVVVVVVVAAVLCLVTPFYAA